MIDLIKCDISDEVFLRYKESYNCTLDALQFMPEKDIDWYCDFLRRNMRKDLKRIKKEVKRAKRMARLEAQRERRGLKRRKPVPAVEPEVDGQSESAAPSELLPSAEVNANEQK